MLRILLIGVGVTLFIVGCSKDKKIERSLIGKWSSLKTSVEATQKYGPSDSSKYSLQVIATGTCEFNKDGTGKCQWQVKKQAKQGQGVVMEERTEETNQFKWRVEDEHLIIEHQNKCHCNNKEEKYFIQERYEDMVVLSSVTKSELEMNCSLCGGIIREQLRWIFRLTKM